MANWYFQLETQSGASLAGSWQSNRMVETMVEAEDETTPTKRAKTRPRRKPHLHLRGCVVQTQTFWSPPLPYPSLSDLLLARYRCPKDRLVSHYKANEFGQTS